MKINDKTYFTKDERKIVTCGCWTEKIQNRYIICLKEFKRQTELGISEPSIPRLTEMIRQIISDAYLNGFNTGVLAERRDRLDMLKKMEKLKKE